jgi:MOSC domain-containing protein YiiM
MHRIGDDMMIEQAHNEATTTRTHWKGRIEFLHTCPRAFLPMRSVTELTLIAGKGIVGDRYMNEAGFYSHKPEEGRQVTLFALEELAAIKREFGIDLVPEEHRRNVTVQGVPLNDLVDRRFWVGEVLVECTRLSFPCTHIEEITGKPIFNALVNRSGINCRILEGGVIRLGNVIRPYKDVAD